MNSRWGAACLFIAVSHAVVHADVTITMTNSMEGPLAGLAGANMPSMTMRIQGLKARTDMDIVDRSFATISDVAARQALMLDQTQKTVQRVPFNLSGQPDAATGGGLNFTMPKTDVALERTGRTEQIAGQSCEEFHIVTTMDMSQAALATPGAPAAMKDLRMVMKGSTWISTSSAAASEFINFQRAAREAGLSMPTNLFGGPGAPDPTSQSAAMEGLPCLSEIDVSYEGTGPMIEMMKKMGPMKVTSRLTEVSLAPVDPGVFAVPDGYKESALENPFIPRR